MAFDAAFGCGLITEKDAAAIAERIRDAGHDQRARLDAEGYLATARAALDALPDKPERDLMRQMTDYVRDRKK